VRDLKANECALSFIFKVMPVNSKLYLDTSVINFLFADDSPELKSITSDFFKNFIETGIYDCFVSEYVLLEINKTTDQIKKEKLLSIIEDYPISLLEITQEKEIEFLADEYLSKYIIPQNKKLDALHVAVATVLKMDCLVSWNYKHLANINREKKIIAVNLLHNYTGSLRICTPLELIDYGI
jgi:predicted nucleic acid-binding protein